MSAWSDSGSDGTTRDSVASLFADTDIGDWGGAGEIDAKPNRGPGDLGSLQGEVIDARGAVASRRHRFFSNSFLWCRFAVFFCSFFLFFVFLPSLFLFLFNSAFLDISI